MTPVPETSAVEQSCIQHNYAPAANLFGNTHSGLLKFTSLLNCINATAADRGSDGADINSEENGLLTDALLPALFGNLAAADTNDKQATAGTANAQTETLNMAGTASPGNKPLTGEIPAQGKPPTGEIPAQGKPGWRIDITEEPHSGRVIRITDGLETAKDAVKPATGEISVQGKPGTGEILMQGRPGELSDTYVPDKGQKSELSLGNMPGKRPELMFVGEIKDFSNEKAFKSQADNPVESSPRLAKIENSNLLYNSNVTYGNYKVGDNPFLEITTRPTGFTELLEKIVYVAKSNNSLDVTIKHNDLGKLNINLTMEKGILNVHINTTERVVREFIQNNIQYIVDSLKENGVSIGGFSVNLRDQQDNRGNTCIVDAPVKGFRKTPDTDSSTKLVSIFV